MYRESGGRDQPSVGAWLGDRVLAGEKGKCSHISLRLGAGELVREGDVGVAGAGGCGVARTGTRGQDFSAVAV